MTDAVQSETGGGGELEREHVTAKARAIREEKCKKETESKSVKLSLTQILQQ